MYNYCKTCCHDDGDIGFCDKCYYNHILEEKGIPPTEYEAKPKPMTNGDRIRRMTDEELAKFIAPLASCPHCYARRVNIEDCGYDCKKAWLDWLKQEAQ